MARALGAGCALWLLAVCCCLCDGKPSEPYPHGLNLDLETSNLLEDSQNPERQLSPTTQSFLEALGTALGPIVGAIIGPLLTNIGQNLSSGSGAQAIAQLQQAASGGATPAPPTSPPQQNRPTAKPSRPSKPQRRPATSRPARPASTAPQQNNNAVVLDVPGHGPFLFLMAANLSAPAQAAAVQQAQAQAAQFLSNQARPPIPPGSQYPLQGALATKPTSVGEIPPRPTLPSYNSPSDGEDVEDGEEEVAAPEVKAGRVKSHSEGAAPVKDRVTATIYSHEDDSLLPSLFPELESS